MYLDKFNILLCTDAITHVWYSPKTALGVRACCDLVAVRIKLIYTYLVVLQKPFIFLDMWVNC